MKITAGRRSSAVAALLVVAVTLTGCSGASSDTPSTPEQHQVETLRALPFGDAAAAVVTEVLTGAGIGVSADDAEVTGGEPVRVTRWQALNLGVEAANGGGVPGDALAATAPVPQGAPPVPYLVAAWITTYDSPSARFARELMGEQDWRNADTVLFPNLVLTLFLADAVAAGHEPGHPAPQAMALAAAARAEPCTFASTFVQNAITKVANALKVNTSGGGLIGFLGSIWNVAVDLAATAVKGLIDAVTKPIVDLIADGFGIVAVITQLSSFLVTWRLDLRPDPSHTRFGVDSEQITGQFQLTVAQDQPPIPDVIIACADAVDVDLRNAGSAAGSKVIWTGRNTGRADLSTRLSADDALRQDKTARYQYQTGQESNELAQSPDTETFALVVSTQLQRNDVQKVRQLFTKLLFDHIPADLQNIVSGLAQPLLDQADNRLAAITALNASARTFITFHTPEQKTPTPQPGGGNGNGARAVIPTECPTAVVAQFGYSYLDNFNPAGLPLSCQYVGASALQLVVGVEPAAFPTPPADVINAAFVDVPGADAAWIGGRDDGPLGPDWGLSVVVGDQTLTIAAGEPKERIIAIAKAILGVG